MNTNLPSPTQNPLSFLQAAGQFPPHRDIVTLLADPTLVAAVKQTGDPERAADYIFAVARHLPTESTRMTSVTDPKKQSSTGRARASRELEAHSPLSVIVNVSLKLLLSMPAFVVGVGEIKRVSPTCVVVFVVVCNKRPFLILMTCGSLCYY